jgi:hypothetical protein
MPLIAECAERSGELACVARGAVVGSALAGLTRIFNEVTEGTEGTKRRL